MLVVGGVFSSPVYPVVGCRRIVFVAQEGSAASSRLVDFDTDVKMLMSPPMIYSSFRRPKMWACFAGVRASEPSTFGQEGWQQLRGPWQSENGPKRNFPYWLPGIAWLVWMPLSATPPCKCTRATPFSLDNLGAQRKGSPSVTAAYGSFGCP